MGDVVALKKRVFSLHPNSRVMLLPNATSHPHEEEKYGSMSALITNF